MQSGPESHFREEYCDLLVDHMARGHSFESFGSVVNKSRKTLYKWVDKFETFSEAKEIGTLKSLEFFEKLGMAAMAGRIKGFQAAVYIFTMKNRHGWRDQLDLTADTTIKTVTLNYTITDDKHAEPIALQSP